MKVVAMMIVVCVISIGCGPARSFTKEDSERVEQQAAGNRGYVQADRSGEETAASLQNAPEAQRQSVEPQAINDAQDARRQARLNRSYMWGTDEPQPGYPDRWTQRRTRQSVASSAAAGQPIPQITLPEEQPIETLPAQAAQGNVMLPETKTPVALESRPLSPAAPQFTEYTVQKGDTLGSISQKVYGTASKWQKIFNFNSDVLKNPNKIYPGQKLKIPQD